MTELLNMETPRTVAQLHLNLINTTSFLLADIEAFRVTLNDPLRSMTALSQYINHATNFDKAINNINTFLARY
jgi:hypothetical protein